MVVGCAMGVCGAHAPRSLLPLRRLLLTQHPSPRPPRAEPFSAGFTDVSSNMMGASACGLGGRPVPRGASQPLRSQGPGDSHVSPTPPPRSQCVKKPK